MYLIGVLCYYRNAALQLWQETNGLNATYRKLIEIFIKAGKTTYANAVCEVFRMTPG